MRARRPAEIRQSATADVQRSMAHTVFLVHGLSGVRNLGEFSNLKRVSAVAFTSREADGVTGFGEADVMQLDEETREMMAHSVYSLYEMVATPELSPDADPRAIVRERLGNIKSALRDLEASLGAVNVEDRTTINALMNAAEALRHVSEQNAFALMSWDAQR